MMDLIKINIDESGRQTVNARDLHKFLEVGKDFANWITDRIRQHGFVENMDYVAFHNSGVNPAGGRPRKEYHTTVNMAKELSMVERNTRGKQARKYFIDCERTGKNLMEEMLSDPVQLRRLLTDYPDKDSHLEKENTEIRPNGMSGLLKQRYVSRLQLRGDWSRP